MYLVKTLDEVNEINLFLKMQIGVSFFFIMHLIVYIFFIISILSWLILILYIFLIIFLNNYRMNNKDQYFEKIPRSIAG